MRQSQSGLGHQNRLQIRRGWGAKGTVLARGTTDADINVESSGPTTLVFQRVTIQPLSLIHI